MAGWMPVGAASPSPLGGGDTTHMELSPPIPGGHGDMGLGRGHLPLDVGLG